MTKWIILDDCPEWPLRGSLGSGRNDWQRMCSAVAETFSETEDGPITHVHFYTDIEKAREIWRKFQDTFPSTITSVSFNKPIVWEDHIPTVD